MDKYEPVYVTFKIWKECSFTDKNFVKFLKAIQLLIPTQIKYISVGKNEDDILIMTDDWVKDEIKEIKLFK